MKPLIFSHNASQTLVSTIAEKINGAVVQIESREFPDGETYIRIARDCSNQNAIIIADLHQPNAKILPLIFLCDTLKDLGIKTITLVAPYLPYMRQDKQFKNGEGITSRFFSNLISQHIDHLITIDPHLHRYNSLDEIYSISSTVVHATSSIAQWIKNNIKQPLIVGPDSESEQWAKTTAEIVDCPYIVLQKERMGDRNVLVSDPKAGHYKDHIPVLIDDIISTGKTMIKTAEALIKNGLSAPVCIGVHALFSDDAYNEMKQADINNIVTCTTVPHESNAIDIASLLATAILAKLKLQ